jgi:fatty-acyl-CoA synthase
VPDARYGEELCAWVRLWPGAPEPTADALRDYAAGMLARYKIPRYVHVEHDRFCADRTGDR